MSNLYGTIYWDLILASIGFLMGAITMAAVFISMRDRKKLKSISAKEIIRVSEEQSDMNELLVRRERKANIKERELSARERAIDLREGLIETRVSRINTDWSISLK